MKNEGHAIMQRFFWNVLQGPNVVYHNMKNLSVYLKSTMVKSWKINSIGGKGRWGQSKKEINRGKGLRRGGDQRGFGRLGAAYNYHFLSIKTFRCAHAVAVACSISHQPESCTRARPLPLLLFLWAISPHHHRAALLSSLFTTVLE